MKESTGVKQIQQEGWQVLPVGPRWALVPDPIYPDPPIPLFPSSPHKTFLPDASQRFWLGWIYLMDAGAKFQAQAFLQGPQVTVLNLLSLVGLWLLGQCLAWSWYISQE